MTKNAKIYSLSLILFVFAAGLALGTHFGSRGLNVAEAEQSAPAASPVKRLAVQPTFSPGTEELKPDEMRVFACGTGMPNARPKQAAACFLLELGNGDKFIFDAGLGSAERISAMKIPYDYLDKVFLGHLHVDHIGDLDAIWIGGSIANRQRPLRVWGPSGSKKKYGTKYMVNKLREAYTWDLGSRQGNVNTKGLQIEVHEFDYKKVNNVIYQENGVTIRTLPAIHGIDGSVSFVVEWNGLKFAFSSDTYPNKWWLEHAKGADLAIHECFATPAILNTKQRFPVEDALNVGTQVHTSPAMFGKVMSEIKPRMAVGYHFFNDFDTLPEMTNEVRKTYDGPLTMAVDYMVWNVTKDDIRVRMTLVDEDVWPQPSITEKLPANPKDRIGFSTYISDGRHVYEGTVQAIYDETNKRFGTKIAPPSYKKK